MCLCSHHIFIYLLCPVVNFFHITFRDKLRFSSVCLKKIVATFVNIYVWGENIIETQYNLRKVNIKAHVHSLGRVCWFMFVQYELVGARPLG